ncbi:MAG: 30S ribosomal protein S20 [Patescibacteria group bacterium]
MPIIKSAKKRVKVTKKAAARNSKTKRTLRSALKNFQASLSGGKATGTHNQAQSALDKAAKKGILHKNKVARKKRQLAAKAKAAGIKPASSVKKTTAKKPATKSPAKKTVAKKSTVKKTTKSPAAKKK